MADTAEEPMMFCLGCRHLLPGLDSDRCPECGRRFDPSVPETYASTPHLEPGQLSFDAVAAAVGMVLLWMPVLGSPSRSYTLGLGDLLWITCFALTVGFALGAVRQGGVPNRIIGGLTLVLTVPQPILLAISVGWREVWTYWTYWHWISPSW